MIKVVSKGDYILYEDHNKRKILKLGDAKLLYWTDSKIIQAMNNSANPKDTLSLGKYRLYKILDEPQLTNNYHLELYVGNKQWRGYLLSSNILKTRMPVVAISATNELISVCKCQCSNCTEISC